MDLAATRACSICHAEAHHIGDKMGNLKRRPFHLFRCPNCRFAFIGNPWTDFHEIYSEAYYNGKGADPLVDYLFELEHPDQTIRQYEWAGILRAVCSLFEVGPSTRWLDFGCGNGGLVRYINGHTNSAVFGFEEGWISDQARQRGIALLRRDDLEGLKGSFDIVTAIEVLEHLPDPVAELTTIRSLLKPGGLFFYTTGNAAPHAKNLLEWSYLIPELHVSFFEPGTLAKALEKAGFRSEFPGFLPGYEDIIRFKVLKTLKLRTTTLWERVLPWSIISRIVDHRFQVSGHPIGRAESKI